MLDKNETKYVHGVDIKKAIYKELQFYGILAFAEMFDELPEALKKVGLTADEELIKETKALAEAAVKEYNKTSDKKNYGYGHYGRALYELIRSHVSMHCGYTRKNPEKNRIDTKRVVKDSLASTNGNGKKAEAIRSRALCTKITDITLNNVY